MRKEQRAERKEHRNYINEKNLKIEEEKIEEFQRMTMGFQNSLSQSLFSIFYLLLI